MVEPREVVSGGPRRMVKQASIVLDCIYEENKCKRHAKTGCLPRILPERGVSVKRRDRARKYSNSRFQQGKIKV